MATDKPITITVPEIKSLADRLMLRGLSANAFDCDLRLAAMAMRAMIRHLNDFDVLYL
jgi:hypothetical protein